MLDLPDSHERRRPYFVLKGTDHRPPTTTNITPSSPPTSAGGTPSEAEDPVRARVTDPAVNRMAGPGLRAEPADSRSLCVVVASEIK